MSLKHIFIHSMWRTSSTYVWHCFRRLDGVKGFYEPFHTCLRVMTPENAQGESSKELGHSVGSPYWVEYADVAAAEGGIPYYSRNFAVKCYIPSAKGLGKGQKAYIQVLLSNAEQHGQQACLGFVRSCMRAGAIRAAFDGSHLALVRNPFTQFTSCYQRRGFMVSVGQVADLLKKHFIRIGGWYDDFCKDLAPEYHDAVRFAIYYCVSNLTALIHSHLAIDTDLLAGDLDYRANTTEKINSLTGVTPDFSDCVSAGSTDPALLSHYQILDAAIASLTDAVRQDRFHGLVGLWKAYPQTLDIAGAITWLDTKRQQSQPNF